MIVQLSEKWSRKLVNQPESGMGYQVVQVHLNNGRVFQNVHVLNAQEMALPEGVGVVEESDIKEITVER